MDQGTEGPGLVAHPSWQAPQEAEWPVMGRSQLPNGGPNPEPFLFPGPWPLLLGSAGSWLKESYLLIPGEPVSGGMGHFQHGYSEDVGTMEGQAAGRGQRSGLDSTGSDSSEAKKQKRFRTEQKGAEQCSVRTTSHWSEAPSSHLHWAVVKRCASLKLFFWAAF